MSNKIESQEVYNNLEHLHKYLQQETSLLSHINQENGTTSIIFTRDLTLEERNTFETILSNYNPDTILLEHIENGKQNINRIVPDTNGEYYYLTDIYKQCDSSKHVLDFLILETANYKPNQTYNLMFQYDDSSEYFTFVSEPDVVCSSQVVFQNMNIPCKQSIFDLKMSIKSNLPLTVLNIFYKIYMKI